jgi:hypothetical protein
VYTSPPIWIKFSIIDLLEMPLNKCALRENGHSESHILFRGISEILAYVVLFFLVG